VLLRKPYRKDDLARAVWDMLDGAVAQGPASSAIAVIRA
jgi:hypothetical protein